MGFLYFQTPMCPPSSSSSIKCTRRPAVCRKRAICSNQLQKMRRSRRGRCCRKGSEAEEMYLVQNDTEKKVSVLYWNQEPSIFVNLLFYSRHGVFFAIWNGEVPQRDLKRDKNDHHAYEPLKQVRPGMIILQVPSCTTACTYLEVVWSSFFSNFVGHHLGRSIVKTSVWYWRQII